MWNDCTVGITQKWVCSHRLNEVPESHSENSVSWVARSHSVNAYRVSPIFTQRLLAPCRDMMLILSVPVLVPARQTKLITVILRYTALHGGFPGTHRVDAKTGSLALGADSEALFAAEAARVRSSGTLGKSGRLVELFD
jgi:hypothetical protein